MAVTVTNMATLNDAPLPEWVRPDLWFDENNALNFFTDDQHSPEPVGATWWHRNPKHESGWCAGGFRWEPSAYRPDGAVWTLIQREPLTVSPSLRCLSADCGAHGFIRDGKWVPA